MYQPSGRAPVASVWTRIASAISVRSSASDMSLCSIHFRLWLAMSQPASFMAATTSGFRFSAVATPNTVAGKLRSVNIRHSRQKPAREPYSNIDLDIGVALARPGLRAQHVGQERFRGAVAVQNIVLAALLEIHHELHGDARVAGPLRIGRVAAVAAEIAGVVGLGHARLPRSGSSAHPSTARSCRTRSGSPGPRSG